MHFTDIDKYTGRRNDKIRGLIAQYVVDGIGFENVPLPV